MNIKIETTNETFRRQMIQLELDALIQATEFDMKQYDDVDDDNDDHHHHHQLEFEPEAIETLDIAAHHVAYRKKYYDVASC